MVRPGVNKFLTELSQYFEIVIYTAALKDYADWILNSIDRKKVISHRLYRQHTLRKKNYAIKNLNLIGREIEKTIIIDNIGENFEHTNPDNGLQIVSWYDDLDDTELDKYIPFLKEMVLRKIPDVREVISKYRYDFDSFVNNL
jgi:CTD small phosphatase-like protein 2